MRRTCLIKCPRHLFAVNASAVDVGGGACTLVAFGLAVTAPRTLITAALTDTGLVTVCEFGGPTDTRAPIAPACVRFSPEGRRLGVCDMNKGVVELWCPLTGSCLVTVGAQGAGELA